MNQLRSRMVVAAMAVALLPAVPLSFLVHNLLEKSFQGPLAGDVEAALEAALEDSRDRLREEKEGMARWSETAGVLPAPPPRATDRVLFFGRGEDAVRTLTSLDNSTPADVVEWVRQHVNRSDSPPPGGRVGPERVGDHLLVAAPAADGTRVLVRPLPEGMRDHAGRITETLGLLRGWQRERGAVLMGYVWPFVLTYAALLVVAAAVGTLLARRIARPVEALAEAAHQVGTGDLSARVHAESSGEVGELVHAFNSMVAELERQRGELSRLERVAAWRDLARSLAHEIKNPLTPIQLAVQQLGDQAPAATDPKYRALLDECVEIVNEEVAALRRLVREFSEFARLPEPHPVPGDLGALFADLGRLYGERVGCDVPDQPVRARFDEAELRRALINLIDNGLAACAEAGRPERVTLAARSSEPAGPGGVPATVEIRVTDQGCGVPPENRERIFEPNFSTKSEGMGLGLAIVEGIVRGHGSGIQVESEPGQGTTFRWTLLAEGGES